MTVGSGTTPDGKDAVEERIRREQRLLEAVVDLLDVTGARTFSIRLPGAEPPLYVTFGDRRQILEHLDR